MEIEFEEKDGPKWTERNEWRKLSSASLHRDRNKYIVVGWKDAAGNGMALRARCEAKLGTA